MRKEFAAGGQSRLSYKEGRRLRGTRLHEETNLSKVLLLGIGPGGETFEVLDGNLDEMGNRTTGVTTTTETDKNVAADGFGRVTKQCGSLVPGLVPDGAGGCTKAVQGKEKILRVDRRKRQSEKVTIQIGQFTTKLQDENNPMKGAATDGFGRSKSRCSSLVPGLVSDGAGGCTKTVKVAARKNKLQSSFHYKSSGEPNIPTHKDMER